MSADGLDNPNRSPGDIGPRQDLNRPASDDAAPLWRPEAPDRESAVSAGGPPDGIPAVPPPTPGTPVPWSMPAPPQSTPQPY